jgi:spermidine/putrescine transport system ATP-binding protein
MRGRNVELIDVAMRFGEFTAVQPTDLAIEAGEFFSILGPSGCGKTTILRMVSGFLEPSRGEIRIGGAPMRGIAPNRRPTALIFQNLALFPLMPVWENVAFGLEARGMAKPARRARAEELLRLVALEGQGGKRPAELSGGQRQRVAIARALAVEPAVLLLDEPLSALDLKLRQHMRTELRAIQKRVGITFIYITHDQGEALTMSDRIAVMSQGRIEQVATPDRLYAEPATAFVATFVGENNLLRGRIVEAADGLARAETRLGPVLAANPRGLAVGAEAMLFVRPERLELEPGGGLDNRLEGRITRRALEGPYLHLAVATAAGQELLVHATNRGGGAGWQVGAEVRLGFAAREAMALPAGPLAADA